jgi:hypothetical protein
MSPEVVAAIARNEQAIASVQDIMEKEPATILGTKMALMMTRTLTEAGYPPPKAVADIPPPIFASLMMFAEIGIAILATRILEKQAAEKEGEA